ncbi:MAG: LysM peptidoglycan-binding domain-containing protein [Thiomargarita sp.]|nr:LysM peptidoglycan-binding domain-containing protein [Thiomargarita sp.]
MTHFYKTSLLLVANLLCFTHIVQGATIWHGASGNLNIHWTQTDITATAKNKILFSALTLAKKDFEADFLADHSLGKDNPCEYERSFTLLSVVGSIASLEDAEYTFCQGAAHPSIETKFTAIDLAKSGQTVKLTDFFAESDILNALLADGVINTALENAGAKTPTTLTGLYEALEWTNMMVKNCEYYLPENFLTRFAFHHLKGNQVAMRLHLSPIAHVCQSTNIQLGFYLPIPSTLKVDINKAKRRKAGFLMKQSKKIADKKSTKLSFSTATYSHKANVQPSTVSKKTSSDKITVQMGDTLYSISKRHGCQVADLVAWNNLQPPYNLSLDQSLWVNPPSVAEEPKNVEESKKPNLSKPTVKSTPQADKETISYHKVTAGETLYGIVKRYNRNFKEIITWNDLQPPYYLLIGQKLQVSPPKSDKIQGKGDEQRENNEKTVVKQRIMIKTNVNMRSKHKLNARRVGQLKFGTVVKELARSNRQVKIGSSKDYWYQIEKSNGKTGWIFGSMSIPFDAKQKGEIYLQIAQKRLQEKLNGSNQIDLLDFLTRAKEEIQFPVEIAVELALLHLSSLQKTLEQLDMDKQNKPPYVAWLKKQEQEELIFYNEIGGNWIINPDVFWRLHEAYYPLPVAESIAWAGANAPLGGECENFLECSLEWTNRTTAKYLKYHPTGKQVGKALEQIVELLKSDAEMSKEDVALPRLLAVLQATVEKTNHPKKAQVLRQIEKWQQLLE